MNDLDVGVVSVIASAAIAIASLLFPLVLGLFRDTLKWKREKRDLELQGLDEAADELLKDIAIFRSGDIRTATHRPEAEIYSRLLGRYYVWERFVWPYVREGNEREQVRSLRRTIELAETKALFEEAPRVAEEIIYLTHTIRERIK